MTRNELLMKILPPLVEWEVERLKASGREFKLNYATFDPTNYEQCLYGQTFESSYSRDAFDFKLDNSIPLLFTDWSSILVVSNDPQDNSTALEILSLEHWSIGNRERVIKLLSSFITWTNKPKEAEYEDIYSIQL